MDPSDFDPMDSINNTDMRLVLKLDGEVYYGTAFDSNDVYLVDRAESLLQETATSLSEGTFKYFSLGTSPIITCFSRTQVERAILSIEYVN